MIVDEVHERDINTDFLLILLREIVRSGRSDGVKVVLMSASMVSRMFTEYFRSARWALKGIPSLGSQIKLCAVALVYANAYSTHTHSHTHAHSHTHTHTQYPSCTVCDGTGSLLSCNQPSPDRGLEADWLEGANGWGDSRGLCGCSSFLPRPLPAYGKWRLHHYDVRGLVIWHCGPSGVHVCY